MNELLTQMYLDREGSHEFDTPQELDNIESMDLFLEKNELHGNVVIHDGTMVFLYGGTSEMMLILESGGRGDMYSHVISYYLQHVSELGLNEEEIEKINKIRKIGEYYDF